VPYPKVVGDCGNARHALHGILGSVFVKMLIDPANQRNCSTDYLDGDVGIIHAEIAPEFCFDTQLDITVRSSRHNSAANPSADSVCDRGQLIRRNVTIYRFGLTSRTQSPAAPRRRSD